MVDPSGAMGCGAENSYGACGGDSAFFGGGDFSDDQAAYQRAYGGLSRNIVRGLMRRNVIDDPSTGYDIELDRFSDGTIAQVTYKSVTVNTAVGGWSLNQVNKLFALANASLNQINLANRRENAEEALKSLPIGSLMVGRQAHGEGFTFSVTSRNRDALQAFLNAHFRSGRASIFHLGAADCGVGGQNCIDYRSDTDTMNIKGSMQITFNARAGIGYVVVP